MAHSSLALKLRVLRAKKAWTIEEAAARDGIMPDTLSDAERGKRHPYMPTLAKIAEAYGVPVEDLLEEPEAALAGASPGKGEASETGPSDQGTGEEQLPKTVAEVREKFLPIAAILEDYCRAYEQLIERAELTSEDVGAFVQTALDAYGYHEEALEVEIRALGYVLDRDRKLTQKQQLDDLSVLRPALARYYELMQALVGRLPAGAEKSRLAELAARNV